MSNFLRSSLSSIVLVGALGALLSAQAQQATAPAPGQPATQPQTPSRTPPRGRPDQAPAKGTAIIRGSVVAADTGAPLKRVSVRATAPETRSSGVTTTTADGKFEIKELPAGRYTVSISKGAYVNMSYGQRRPTEPGTPIEVTDGQIVEKVNFAMVKGGVITGQVTDDTGEPMTGVNVSVMRYQFMAGSRRLMPSGMSSRTDDTGTYRVYGLAPGDYYVNAAGGFGGGNVVVSTAGSNTETDAYAPTYYPGTPNVAEAQRVSIKVGQVLMGMNFAVTPTRLASLRGRVLNSRGEPGRGLVMVVPSDATGYSFSTGPGNNIGADGSFLLANIAPGRYNINVRPMGMQGPEAEFAVAPITVGTEDIDNVLLTTGVGVTARGIVQTDEGTPPPFRADEVLLSAQLAEPMPMLAGGGAPKINGDYTFEVASLSERRIIRASIANQPGWYLKAVYFDGDDVTDSGIEFTTGRSYDGLQVVFTQKATELSGIVSDSRGRPVVDASVVVFTSNRDRWVTTSRYLRTVRPDTEGRYTVKGLPPGDDYVIIAVQGLETGQGGDPEFLARAREEAKSLTLTDGEKKAFDVKLSTLVP